MFSEGSRHGAVVVGIKQIQFAGTCCSSVVNATLNRVDFLCASFVSKCTAMTHTLVCSKDVDQNNTKARVKRFNNLHTERDAALSLVI